jgi:DNA-binding CsgD family transcriptional regulator
MSSEQSIDDPLRGLTTKQCEVLDLLIQHKTSKEISRLLGISPHTVDQRIMLSRAKLHVSTRSEVAQAYRKLLTDQGEISGQGIYQRSVYGSPDIAQAEQWVHDGDREDHDGFARSDLSADTHWKGAMSPQAAELAPGDSFQPYYHVLPEAFDGRGGTWLRLGAIAMITVFLTLMILGGMAMYSELAHMLDS